MEVKLKLKTILEKYKRLIEGKQQQDSQIFVEKIIQAAISTGDINFCIPFCPYSDTREISDGSAITDATSLLALSNIYNFIKEIQLVLQEYGTSAKVQMKLMFDVSAEIGLQQINIPLSKYSSYLKQWKALIEQKNAENQEYNISVDCWDIGEHITDSSFQEQMESSGEKAVLMSLESKIESCFVEHKIRDLEIYRGTQKGTSTGDGIRQKQRSIMLRYANVPLIESEALELAVQQERRLDLFRAVSDQYFDGYIRFSPHAKGIAEQSKFGFSFFPGELDKSGRMPWVGELIRFKDGSFILADASNIINIESYLSSLGMGEVGNFTEFVQKLEDSSVRKIEIILESYIQQRTAMTVRYGKEITSLGSGKRYQSLKKEKSKILKQFTEAQIRLDELRKITFADSFSSPILELPQVSSGTSLVAPQSLKTAVSSKDSNGLASKEMIETWERRVVDRLGFGGKTPYNS
jgi:hypothetical protein